MFAGGGAIPLEALRLGCESFALELNPVAHIIEFALWSTLRPTANLIALIRGMTGPENGGHETTWGGLANEVRYCGDRVLKEITPQIKALYPAIPDPQFRTKNTPVQVNLPRERQLTLCHPDT